MSQLCTTITARLEYAGQKIEFGVILGMRKMALQKKMEEKEEREKGEKGNKGRRNFTVDRLGSFQGKGGSGAKKKQEEGGAEEVIFGVAFTIRPKSNANTVRKQFAYSFE